MKRYLGFLVDEDMGEKRFLHFVPSDLDL